MPVQKQQSLLAQKLGERGKKAHEAHKNDELTLSKNSSDAPAGIEGGIAQLTDCRFAIHEDGDNKGQLYFYAAGVVVHPETLADGTPVAGLRTWNLEPLYDTPDRASRKTTEDHYAWVLNEMRKFGVDTKTVTYDNVEAVAQMLRESGPHFRFRTWKGKPSEAFPNPRTNHDWGKACNYARGDGQAVVDQTSEAPADTEVAPDETAGTTAVAEATESEGGAEDLDQLAALADGGDTDAQKKLDAMCKPLSIDSGPMENWVAVVEAIRAAIDGGNTSTEETPKAEETEVVPAKKEVYYYRPTDPKTKKPVKKAIECEVVAVFEKSKLVNLKNLDDGKTQYKCVPWSALDENG